MSDTHAGSVQRDEQGRAAMPHSADPGRYRERTSASRSRSGAGRPVVTNEDGLSTWSALLVRPEHASFEPPGVLERRFWGHVGEVLDQNIREGDMRMAEGRSVVVLFPNTPPVAALPVKERLVRTLKEQVKPGLAFPPGWDAVTTELFPLSEAAERLGARRETSTHVSDSGGTFAAARRGVSPELRSEPLKRALDAAGALAGLLLASPLWLVIAVGIKLSSRGPILFSQPRVGIRGETFTMLKFRTMRVEADDVRHRAYMEAYIRGVQAPGEEKDAPFKLAGDDRIFPFGRFLRKWSLDELPQLLNVLRGDMSLTGPRPSVFYELEEYQPWHRRRLEVKPGLTGLWQVYGRGRTTFDEMVRLDLQYVQKRSVLLDLKLLALTIPTVLTRRGAG